MSVNNIPSASSGFISFEGIEGSGKSTQTRLFADYLSNRGFKVLTTAEPGGTHVGDRVRKILLDRDNQMDALTELLLYSASRAQLLREVIYPALTADTIVITDRYSDSTIAYQGVARGMDMGIIKALDEITTTSLKPAITFLLDMDVESGLKRNRQANKTDRFELEAIAFHEKVRQGFLQIAGAEPHRVKVITATGSENEVHRRIVQTFEKIWPAKIS